MAERLTRLLLKFRLAIVLSWIAVTLALAAAAFEYSSFSSDYRVYFAADNPELLAYERIEQTYTSDDSLLIALQFTDGSIFTPDRLALIAEITDDAWQVPNAIRVDSVSNFQYTEASDEELIVGGLVSGSQSLTEEEAARVGQIALNEPALLGRLVSADGRTAGILVSLLFPGADHREHVPQSVNAARDLVANIRASHPDIRVALTGTALISRSLDEMTLRDLLRLTPALFGVLLILLALLLRSMSGMFAAGVVIAISATAAMGLAALFGITLTTASVMAPVIVLTLAVADSVHFISTSEEAARDGKDRPAALARSMHVNLEPIFLTSLTTLIGFLSLNFSASPPFHDLGNITAMGVVVAWAASMTLLPALYSYLPWGRGKPLSSEHQVLAAFADFVIVWRGWILILTGILAVAFAALVPLNRLDDQVVHWFGERTEIRQDTDFITENLTGPYRMDFSLRAAGPGDVVDPAYLADLDRFANWLAAQPEVLHVEHFADVMRRLNRSMHGDDEAWYLLPERRDLAAQYLLLYELSLPYGLDLTYQVSFDKSETRVTATLDDITSAAARRLKARAESWAAVNLGHASASEGSGTVVMFAFASMRTINSMLWGTGLAFVLISLTLIVALRNLRLGLLSLIPNVLPVVIAFGIWAVTVGMIGVVASSIAAMTLGLVVDDTVHFLSKYHRARHEQRLNVHDGIRYAFEHVGRALITTSIVLVAGFGVLLLSDFLLNWQTGVLTVMTISIALLLDFFLLPALVMFLDREEVCTCRTCLCPAKGRAAGALSE